MPLLLVVLFLLTPIAELAVIVQVSDGIGLGSTVGLLILVSLLGAWLVKREGLGAWRRVQQQVHAGKVPAAEMVDGVMILVGGALLLTPGFLTDALGLALLLPPVRAVIRRLLRRRITAWVTVIPGSPGAPGSPRGSRVDIGEAVVHERDPDPGPREVIEADEVADDD